MAITEFTLRLLLIFLPGIITRLLLEKLTVTTEKRHFYFIMYAFLLGLLAYAIYSAIIGLVTLLPFWSLKPHVSFLESLLERDSRINIYEIILTSFIAIINGFVLSFIKNRKYLHKFAQLFKIEPKFAEADVWGYVFNSEDDAMRWVRVRDGSKDLCYEGWIDAFSDTFKENEIFLRDVRVYTNGTGQHLYNVPGLYIARSNTDLSIEFYAIN